jgi:hypothetical protein
VVVAAIVGTAPTPAPTWTPGVPRIIEKRVIISATIRIVAAVIRPAVAEASRPTVRIAYANINIGATIIIIP